jgi:photosystem II stability/assembly factor-like uncharacterized protein
MKILSILLVLFTSMSLAIWEKQDQPSNHKFNDVYLSQSSETAYIVGNNGIMYLSENSGETWTQIISNQITNNINAVQFVTSSLGFVITSNGDVFRTANKGDYFDLLSSHTNGNILKGIHFIDVNIGYVVGSGGTLSRTINGGQSWTLSDYNFNEVNLNSVNFNNSNGVIVGNGGTVFNSTNSGVNWTSRTITGVSENLNSVVYTGANNIFIAVGDNGRIIRSTNNGIGWQTVNSNTNTKLNKVHFTPNSNNGFIVGDGGIILYTSNAGLSWIEQNNNDNNNLNSIAFKNNALGLAVGDNGTILSTISSGLNQSVTINYPVGSETWHLDEQVSIQWSAVGIDNVKIEISRDNKISWGQLAVVNANLGVYNWSVSSPISDDVYIRISDNINPNLKDESGKIRITNFNLTITSPSLNNELNINSNHNITWNSLNVENVTLSYSIDNGNTWNLIQSNIPASMGQFNWSIGNTPTNQAKIKIENSDDISQFIISEPFTIVGANLYLIHPNGGNFDAGDIVNIQWGYTNVSKIRIDYTTNGGVSWAGIATNYNASIGSYSWLVPYKPGQTHIRIMSEDDNHLFAISNQSFTINGYDLTILNPLGNSYVAGSNLAIQWQADSRIEKVKIEYSSNGGNNWVLINNSVTASIGSFLWTTPSQAGTNYKIRLTDDTELIVKESNNFALTTLRIISPIANSTIKANSLYTITWEAVGYNSVSLSYSLDNGSNWVNIASNIQAIQGQINDWTTPNINSAILLKIENANDNSQFHTVNLNIQQSGITVSNPQANYFYRSGKEVNIQWNSNLIEYVNIYYSVNNGALVNIANNVIASNGSFTWTAPIMESNQVKIRVADATNNLIFGESGNFGISDDVITILSPNGNEIWNQGETREIRWIASDASLVDIHISNDNGMTWKLIAQNVNANTPYNWTIGTTPGSKSWLKVTDSNKPGIDDLSDASFVINGLDLLSPNGNETYLLNTTEQITWKSVGMNNINIYYSKDGGASWFEIVKNYPALSGYYNWFIPAMTGNNFKIRVIDPTKTNFRDESDNVFNINGIKITSPVSGDKILFGTQKIITFDKFDIQNIKIEHSTDNGQNWYTVIAHTNGTNGQYLWNVPEMPGTQNKLKITSIEVPSLFDITNGTFEIMQEGVAVTFPNGGEILSANSSHTITWASANIDSVKIEFSDNNGISWNTITNATKASDKYYSWLTPNINGYKYLVRITDTKISDIYSVSDNSFSISGGVYILPDEWNFTMGTGKTAHIIVPSNINPKVGNHTIQAGDVIGIFYLDNGVMKCGGYNTWTGSDLAITAWGNNSLTTKKDGFADNEIFRIRVWSQSTGTEYEATVTYSSGNSFFVENGISVLSSFETQRPFNINLQGGTWQFISSNLIPVNPNMAQVMNDVKDDFEYMKNDLGQIYHPNQNINQIGNWNITKGYHIYSHNDAVLSIQGNTILPANYNYIFNSNFWYIIAYLPNDVRNIADVFAGLNNVILVKNSSGQIYYPAFGINQIGTIHPGEGYQIAVSQNAQSFSYSNSPPPPAPVVPGIYSENEPDYSYYKSDISKTGSSAVIIFNNIENWNGEIGVFDSYDRLVGHSKINGLYNSITIWGDNPITFNKDGARENEELRLVFYDYEKKSVRKVEIEQIFELVTSKSFGTKLTYQKDAIFNIEATKVSSSVDDNHTRTSMYPNPASEIIYLNISGEGLYIIDLIDMTGNKVISNEVAVTGQSTIKIDINQLNTGSYIISIRGSGSISTQKFIKIE